MIDVAGTQVALDDPRVLLIAAGAVLLVALLVTLRGAARGARATEALARQVQQIALGQQQLRGGLQTVSDTQVHAQAAVVQTVEERMTAVQQQMNDRLSDNALRSARAQAEMQQRMHTALHGAGRQTAMSLTRLQERLSAIDRAQDNIARLSGDVLGLQDILSNKQTRGAFGEIQLHDIVAKALPPDAFAWQATLSNGRRADCLVHLPEPPGAIVIDSKFPLESYEAMLRAEDERSAAAGRTAFSAALRGHIRAIADRYIIEGETADCALMFLPSEAVYAELHANFPAVVQAGFAARVFVVSPTTCMAVLNTMRAVLKDARMRAQAGEIRKTLGLLGRDLEIVLNRAAKLETHFNQARTDLDGIATAANRAGKRAERLESFEFDAPVSEKVVPIKPDPRERF